MRRELLAGRKSRLPYRLSMRNWEVFCRAAYLATYYHAVIVVSQAPSLFISSCHDASRFRERDLGNGMLRKVEEKDALKRKRNY